MKTAEIRALYLDFFVKNGHENVKSSPLIPDNDPTLMFTNSGMVQFKDVFTGRKTLSYKKATSSQKCLRAGGKHNDLENVGYTSRHHTFFEMLGNFSFGDYFKEEAIKYAWDFINGVLGLSKDKLLITVHVSDEEAAEFWKKIAGFGNDKIIRIPTNDNFWMMGDTGPCGPCSEIFYDHGDKIQGGPPGSADADGDRYVEIWNLVFTQFDALPDGARETLKNKCIDTGMGLERISAIMQGVHNNYDTDIFKTIIEDIKHISGMDDPKYTAHNNVVADHIRSACFMIADGIIPSNEGRGYVLRRIIRRALRHGYTMGIKEPFMHKLVKSVKESMSAHYSEIGHFEKQIHDIIKAEEERFMKTIDNGMKILGDELSKLSADTPLPASVAYKLYDTFGFPTDLTQDILRSENRRNFDEAEFNKIAETEKERARSNWSGTGDSFTSKVWLDLKEQLPEIEFIRNTSSVSDAKILSVVEDNNSLYVVTDKTPFYAESGGQVGDTGTISVGDSNVADVVDTVKINGIHVHKFVVKNGTIAVGNTAKLEINSHRRVSISRNHTATHLLQKALQTVLGSGVAQKGSHVSEERLRFDFIYSGNIGCDHVSQVERLVNEDIDAGFIVNTEVMPIEKAMTCGAMALFGEKYAETVRVVEVGPSKELCGGEHVRNTLQIKLFKITSISSIGSGIKRVEAVTGDDVQRYFESETKELNAKISLLQSTIKGMRKKTNNSPVFANFRKISIKDVIFMRADLSGAGNKEVLSVIDKQKGASERRVVLLVNTNSDTTASVSLFSEYFDTISILNESFSNIGITGIKCGGRKELAQTGGINISVLDRLAEEVAAVCALRISS